MTTKTIYLPGIMRSVTVGEYVKAIKWAKSLPPKTRLKQTLCNWWGGTAQDVRNEFMAGVHDRINQNIKSKNY